MNRELTPASFLKRKYAESLKANPRYSLRAFAAKLGLSQGGLSHILSRRKKLSLGRAHEIAQILKLSEGAKQEFLLLVQLEAAKSPAVKSSLYEQLKSVTASHQGGSMESRVMSLTLENFQLISSWYGLAILEMVTGFGRDWGSDRISASLGIPKVEVEIALERLEMLELIEKDLDGKYTRVEDRVVVSAPTPSEAIRNYYRGVLERANESIQTQSPAEKVVGTEVFAFDPDQIDEARKLTDQYLNQMLELAKKGKQRTEMYQVFTDFFRLNPNLNRPLEVKPKGKEK